MPFKTFIYKVKKQLTISNLINHNIYKGKKTFHEVKKQSQHFVFNLITD